MSPKIHSAFWSDADIETLNSDQKLAYLWILTNSQMNICGFCHVTTRRFAFETGLSMEILESTISALPRALKHFKEHGIIYVRRYIRHQLGDGEQLTKNHIFKSVISVFRGIVSADLRKAILEDYPIIGEVIASQSLSGISSLTQSPSNPLPKGKEKEKEEEKEKENGEVQEGDIAIDILNHLNIRAGRKFEPVPSSLSLIRARLREVDGDAAGVIQMIDRWVKKWTGTAHEEYLQPSTLFAVKKFQERYANRNLPVISDTAPPHVQLRSIDEELSRHVANSESPRFNRECSQQERDNYIALKKLRIAVNAKVAAGGQR